MVDSISGLCNPGAWAYLARCLLTPQPEAPFSLEGFTGRLLIVRRENTDLEDVADAATALAPLFKEYLPPADLLTWGWKLSFLVGGILGLLASFFGVKCAKATRLLASRRRIKQSQTPSNLPSNTIGKQCSFASGLSLLRSDRLFPRGRISHGAVLKNIQPQRQPEHSDRRMLPRSRNHPPTHLWNNQKKPPTNTPKQRHRSSAHIAPPLRLHPSAIPRLDNNIPSTPDIFSLHRLRLFPALSGRLFSTTVRYTCLGFSFNICDSLIVGASPILIHSLIKTTGQPASFILILPLTALIFLACPFPPQNQARLPLRPQQPLIFRKYLNARTEIFSLNQQHVIECHSVLDHRVCAHGSPGRVFIGRRAYEPHNVLSKNVLWG